jgi:hypothetical protein
MTIFLPIPIFLHDDGEEEGLNPYSNKKWEKKMRKKYGKDYKESCPYCGSIYCKNVGGINNCHLSEKGTEQK